MLVFQIKPWKYDQPQQKDYQPPIVPYRSNRLEEGWARFVITAKEGEIHLHNNKPVFSLIVDGNREGQYTDIKYNLASGTYSSLKGAGWAAQPAAQAVCYNLQVKKNMVSGEGALISVGSGENGRPALIVTQSPKKDPKSAGDYANTYLTYDAGRFDKTILYKGPTKPGETEAPINRYPNGRFTAEKVSIEIRDPSAISLELFGGVRNKLEPIPTRTEAPAKVPEYAGIGPIQRQGLSFGHYEEVRIPLRIFDPARAAASISFAGTEVSGVHVQKNADGLLIGGGALNKPGEYKYAVNDKGQIARGSFNIRA